MSPSCSKKKHLAKALLPYLKPHHDMVIIEPLITIVSPNTRLLFALTFLEPCVMNWLVWLLMCAWSTSRPVAQPIKKNYSKIQGEYYPSYKLAFCYLFHNKTLLVKLNLKIECPNLLVYLIKSLSSVPINQWWCLNHHKKPSAIISYLSYIFDLGLTKSLACHFILPVVHLHVGVSPFCFLIYWTPWTLGSQCAP
jgi:hypothetical protein